GDERQLSPIGKRGVAGTGERRALLMLGVELVEEPEARVARTPTPSHPEPGIEDGALDALRHARLAPLRDREDRRWVHQPLLPPAGTPEHAGPIGRAVLGGTGRSPLLNVARAFPRWRVRSRDAVAHVGYRVLRLVDRLAGQLLGLVEEAHRRTVRDRWGPEGSDYRHSMLTLLITNVLMG